MRGKREKRKEKGGKRTERGRDRRGGEVIQRRSGGS